VWKRFTPLALTVLLIVSLSVLPPFTPVTPVHAAEIASDNFNDNSLDTSYWFEGAEEESAPNQDVSVNEINQRIEIDIDGGGGTGYNAFGWIQSRSIYSWATFTLNLTFDTQTTSGVDSTTSYSGGGFATVNSTTIHPMFGGAGNPHNYTFAYIHSQALECRLVVDNGSVYNLYSQACSLDTWYEFQVIVNTTHITFYIDDSEKYSDTHGLLISSGHVSFLMRGNENDNSAWFDNYILSDSQAAIDWYVTYYFDPGIQTFYLNGSGTGNATQVGYANESVVNVTSVPRYGFDFGNYTYDATSNSSNPFYLTVLANYTLWSYSDMWGNSTIVVRDNEFLFWYGTNSSKRAVSNLTQVTPNLNGLSNTSAPLALYNGSDGSNVYGLWALIGGSFAWGYSSTANGSLWYDGDEIETSDRGLAAPDWAYYSAYFGDDGINPHGAWSLSVGFGWCEIETEWGFWVDRVTVPCSIEWGRPPPDIPGGDGNGNGDDPILLIILWSCDDFLGVGCLNILAIVIMAVIGIALGMAHASDLSIALIELIFAVMFTAMQWFPLWLGIVMSLVMALWTANILRGYFTGGGVEE